MKVLNLFIVVVTNSLILSIAAFMMYVSVESKTANYKIAQSLMGDMQPVEAFISTLNTVTYPEAIVNNVKHQISGGDTNSIFAQNTKYISN